MPDDIPLPPFDELELAPFDAEWQAWAKRHGLDLETMPAEISRVHLQRFLDEHGIDAEVVGTIVVS